MKRFLVRQKLRLDLGQWVMSIFQLCFLIIAAGDKLTWLLGINTRIILFIFLPLALFLVWLVGYLIDKLHIIHEYNNEVNERNTMLVEALKSRS